MDLRGARKNAAPRPRQRSFMTGVARDNKPRAPGGLRLSNVLLPQRN
jgi:hypothetical protein